MAETLIRCPVCSRKLAWRGLHGHLRFEHQLDSEAATEKLTEIKLEMRDSEYRDKLFSAIAEYEEALGQLERINGLKGLMQWGYLVIPEELQEHMKSAAEKEVETAKRLMAEAADDWDSDRRTMRFLDNGIEALGLDQDDDQEGGDTGSSTDG